jgi:HEAT repeat protein
LNTDKREHLAKVRMIKALASPNERIRKLAAQQIACSDLNTVQGLINLLNAERAFARSGERFVRECFWAAPGAWLFFFLARYIPDFNIWTYLCGFGCGTIVIGMRKMGRLNARFRQGIAIAMAQHEDPALLPSLIRLCRDGDRDLVVPVITRLLLRLHATDASILKPRQRTRLNLELLHCNNHLAFDAAHVEFLLAILKAWEQIGDEEAVPCVQMAALRGLNPRVRAAAEQCLPYLEERTEKARVGNTLLRASASMPAPAELLRPAGAEASAEPQQLLRAASSETNAP